MTNGLVCVYGFPYSPCVDDITCLVDSSTIASSLSFSMIVRSVTPYFRLLSNSFEDEAPYGFIENCPLFDRVVALVDVLRIASLRGAPKLGDISLEYRLEG